MKGLFKSALTVLLLAVTATATANSYNKYYQNLPVQMAQATPPQIPANTVNINDCGGVGDGVTLNTEAFEKAIARLTKMGGGRLVVPMGVWLSGPIQLKDNIDLHLEKNAILYFSPDKRLFVDKEGKSERCFPAIRASNRKNIAITGEGIIDGNGQQWRPVKRSKVSDVEWKAFKENVGGVETSGGQLWYPWNSVAGYPNIAGTPEEQERYRADLIRFTNCENILIQGVTVQNSPRFHVHPCYSTNIIIDGITVRCPWNAQNGDAIDLSDCHRALIVNSTVDAGDDGLCMKSGKEKKNSPWGCEDILIENNTVYHAHGGFVIGSESIGGMRRIVVRNNRFAETDIGLRFKSGIGRGGRTENIYISNIVMTDIANEAIGFQCDYVNRPAGSDEKAIPTFTEEQKKLAPHFQDIHISNVMCRGAKTAIKAAGIEGLDCVSDIHIANSTFVYNKTGKDINSNSARLTLTDVRLIENKAESGNSK